MSDDPQARQLAQARDFEGRLIAHRKLLARLLAASSEEMQLKVGAWLSARESLADGQTDPSAVPDDGLALEIAMSDELHEISEMAHALISGTCNVPSDSNAPAFHSLRQDQAGAGAAAGPETEREPEADPTVRRKATPSG